MDTYTIISSKKVTLWDLNEEQQVSVPLDALKHNDVKEVTHRSTTIDVVEGPCNPSWVVLLNGLLSFGDDHDKNNLNKNTDTEIIPKSSALIEATESAVSKKSRIKIVSGDGVQFSFANGNAVCKPEKYVPDTSNSSFDFYQNDQNSALQFSSRSTSNTEHSDETLNEAATEDNAEYFKNEFIESPTNAEMCDDSNNFSDTENTVQEGAPLNADTETDKSMLNGKSLANCCRSCKVTPKVSIEKYLYYMCPQCDLKYETVEEWRLHTDTEHGFGQLETVNIQCHVLDTNGKLCHKCRDCSKTFETTTSYSRLLKHRILHMPYRNYICCRLCGKKYLTKTGVTVHLMNQHNELKVTRKPRTEMWGLEHIRIVCTVCKQNQDSVEKWKTHLVDQHDYFNNAKTNFVRVSDNIYTCNICFAKVRLQTLVEHMLTHEEKKSFICAVCNTEHTLLKTALYHVRIKHLRTDQELLRSCSLCPASFEKGRKPYRHYTAKHKVVRQRCKVCNKSYASTSLLLTHMNKANHMIPKSDK